RAARAAYPERATPAPAPAAARTAPRGVPRRGGRGLPRGRGAPAPAPAWGPPPWPRRVYIALGVMTLALGVVNLASLHPVPTATPAPPTDCRASPCYSLHYPPLSIGQWLLAAAGVMPLTLERRDPLLGYGVGAV